MPTGKRRLGAMADEKKYRSAATSVVDEYDDHVENHDKAIPAQRARHIANKANGKIRISTKLVLAMKLVGCNVHRAKLGDAMRAKKNNGRVGRCRGRVGARKKKTVGAPRRAETA